MNLIAVCGITGFVCGLGYYFYDQHRTLELVPGKSYLVIADAVGEDGETNWVVVKSELEKLKLKGFKLEGSGSKRKLTYVMTPKDSFTKIQIGKPLFQVEGVNFIAKRIQPV
jgi:hypothetical protein